MRFANIKKNSIWVGVIAFFIFAILVTIEAPLPVGVKKDNEIFGIIKKCSFDLPDNTNRSKYGGKEPPFVSMVFDAFQYNVSGYFQTRDLEIIQNWCKTKVNLKVSFTAKKLYISSVVHYRIYQIEELSKKISIDFIKK